MQDKEIAKEISLKHKKENLKRRRFEKKVTNIVKIRRAIRDRQKGLVRRTNLTRSEKDKLNAKA